MAQAWRLFGKAEGCDTRQSLQASMPPCEPPWEQDYGSIRSQRDAKCVPLGRQHGLQAPWRRDWISLCTRATHQARWSRCWSQSRSQMEFKLKDSSFICIHGQGRLPYNINFSVSYLGTKFNDCLLVWLVGLWFSWGWSGIFWFCFAVFSSS